MDKNIGVGLIVGLLIATTIYVYNSKRLSVTQKGILYICVIFPPAQWLLILIFLAVNYKISKNSKEKTVSSASIRRTNQSSKQNDSHQTLKDLHKQGILTDDEYYEKSTKLKSEKLKSEIEQTPEYRKLRSLYDDGILTKAEFEKKVEKIRKPSDLKNSSFNIVSELSDGYYLITDLEINYGFADKNNCVIIKPKYEFAENFTNGLALVRINGKFGFIDTNDILVIDNIYDDAESFKTGRKTTSVRIENDKHYINIRGERV